jgi:thiamine-phosphate pyrophosphorylase
MLLYAITDKMWLNGRSFYDDVEEALKGGVTMLQLREKELDDEAFLKETMKIKKICKKYNVAFIINDNVEVAIKCDADGIHVGQSDMDLLNVRARLGKNKIIGVSAQTVKQAVLAEKNGADYLGVGAVFTTATKEDADYVTYETLKDICNNISIPVCAIGGISDNNIYKLKGSGIDGVALISAIFEAKNIKEECEKLKVLSEEMVKA